MYVYTCIQPSSPQIRFFVAELHENKFCVIYCFVSGFFLYLCKNGNIFSSINIWKNSLVQNGVFVPGALWEDFKL